MRLTIALALLASSAFCSISASADALNTPIKAADRGTRLLVQHDLILKPNAPVFFQDGKNLGTGAVDQQKPYCEVHAVGSEAVVILAGESFEFESIRGRFYTGLWGDKGVYVPSKNAGGTLLNSDKKFWFECSSKENDLTDMTFADAQKQFGDLFAISIVSHPLPPPSGDVGIEAAHGRQFYFNQDLTSNSDNSLLFQKGAIVDHLQPNLPFCRLVRPNGAGFQIKTGARLISQGVMGSYDIFSNGVVLYDSWIFFNDGTPSQWTYSLRFECVSADRFSRISFNEFYSVLGSFVTIL